MKTIHFISGLPRSGSTLLCNILAQNHRFQVGGTSGLVDMLLLVRNSWDKLGEFRAMPHEESEAAKLRVLRGMMANYHQRHMVPTPGGMQTCIIFDKSRSWLAHLEMVEAILGVKCKVLVPIRDIRDVLASLELLWRKASATRQIPHEGKSYHAFQSAQGRCSTWMGFEGLVGLAYNRVRDAYARGFGDRLYLVPYEWLTNTPADMMSAVYDFLGEDSFEHNFDDVEPVTQEDDFAYGIPGLHDIRRKVEPQPSKWEEVLGDAAVPYGLLNTFFANLLQGDTNADATPPVAANGEAAVHAESDVDEQLRAQVREAMGRRTDARAFAPNA